MRKKGAPSDFRGLLAGSSSRSVLSPVSGSLSMTMSPFTEREARESAEVATEACADAEMRVFSLSQATPPLVAQNLTDSGSSGASGSEQQLLLHLPMLHSNKFLRGVSFSSRICFGLRLAICDAPCTFPSQTRIYSGSINHCCSTPRLPQTKLPNPPFVSPGRQPAASSNDSRTLQQPCFFTYLSQQDTIKSRANLMCSSSLNMMVFAYIVDLFVWMIFCFPSLPVIPCEVSKNTHLHHIHTS